MYQNHWNLNDKPFENDFNTEFFVETRDHKEVLNRIIFGVSEQKSLLLVAADHGLGKSYVARVASEKLQRSGTAVGIVSHPIDDSLDFLKQICHAFHIESRSNSRFELFENLRTYLEGVAASGGRSALIVDNADTLDGLAAVRELRKILDWTHPAGGHLLTVVLLAHPKFQDTLQQNHQGLSQRVDVGARLDALNADETKTYILQRLRIAKAPRHMFDNSAIDAVFAASHGVPRVVNRLCDLALVIGTMQRSTKVTESVVDEAIAEIRKLALLSRGLTPKAVKTVAASAPSVSRPRKGRRDTGGDSDRATAKTQDDNYNSESRGRQRSDDDYDQRGRRSKRRGRRDKYEDNDSDSGRPSRRGRRDRHDRNDRHDNSERSDRGRSKRKKDNEPLAFNREDHLDIPSMDDLIRNDLKVQSVTNRRSFNNSGSSNSGRDAEEQDVVQYFGAVAEDRQTSVEDSDSGRDNRRGRRQSGRRRGEKNDRRRGDKNDRRRSDRSERNDRNDRNDKGDRGGKRRRHESSDAATAAPTLPAIKTPAPVSRADMDVEEVSAFGDGLVEIDMDARKKAVQKHRERLAALREAQNDRAQKAVTLRASADKRRAELEAEEDGFASGLVANADKADDAEAEVQEADGTLETGEIVEITEVEVAAEAAEETAAEEQPEVAEETAAVAEEVKEPEASQEAEAETVAEAPAEEVAEAAPAPKKRKPGRPRKASTRAKSSKKASSDEAAEEGEEPKAKKPRRRRKKREESAEEPAQEVKVVSNDEDAE